MIWEQNQLYQAGDRICSLIIAVLVWIFEFRYKYLIQESDNNVRTGSDNGLAPIRWHTGIWTNIDLVWWRIYLSFGLNELNWSHVNNTIRSASLQLQSD